MVNYRRLGRTNIMCFPIAFGGIPIQRINEEEAVKLVRRAIDLGINLIDTARGYTDSEIKIGKALKGVSKKVYISSKSQNRTKDGIYEDVKISLKNLGVDKIDIYHIHGVNDWNTFNKIFEPDGAYPGLLKAKDEGLIDFIAVSSHNNEIMEELIKTDKFDVIQISYNFIETMAEEKIFPLALERDIGIIAMKPMAGGVLPNPKLSLKFALQKEFLVPDPGIENERELEEDIEVVLNLTPLTEEEWREIEKTKEEMGSTFCRKCDYCQPCPQGIPISIVIRADSFLKRLPDSSIRSGWFYDAYLKAQNCIECGTCMTRCPYKLPIIDLIKENINLIRNYLGE